MIKFLPTHVFEAIQSNALIDPDNQLIGQLTFQTDAAWYHFRLSRENLQKLAREIEQSLQASSPEAHKG